MPSEDRGIDLSEVRTPLDTEQGETAEGVSESDMQEYAMERYQSEIEPSSQNYRVTVYDFERPERLLTLEYFDTYTVAIGVFDSICDDDDLVNAYGRFLTVELSKSYDVPSTKAWEVLNRQFCYPTK